MAVARIAFHVTDRCNLNCQHCLRDPAQQPTDVDVALVARVLDEAVLHYGTEHVALTGGEPTLHPRFAEILDAIVDRRLTWHAVTNGARMPHLLAMFAERPARRDGLTVLDLSLDGAREETHDRIRGEGSYREVMSAVAACRAHGIPFLFQMTVNAVNERELEEYALAAANLGAARVSFSWMQPTGTHLDASMYLSPGAWRAIADRIGRLAEAVKLPINMPEGFPTSQPFHVCDPFRSETLHVMVDGRLNLCCQHAGTPDASGRQRDVVADLRTEPLVGAHRKLVALVHEAQAEALDEIAAGSGTTGEWAGFHCNDCLRRFGKPYWKGDGVGGPPAERDRWRGVWSNGATGRARVKRLPLA